MKLNPKLKPDDMLITMFKEHRLEDLLEPGQVAECTRCHQPHAGASAWQVLGWKEADVVWSQPINLDRLVINEVLCRACWDEVGPVLLQHERGLDCIPGHPGAN